MKKVAYAADYLRILSMIWRSGRGYFIFGMAAKIFQAAFPILGLYLVKLLIDTVTAPGPGAMTDIVRIVLALVAVQLAGAGLSQLSGYIGGYQQQKVTNDMAETVIRKAIEVNLEFYENPKYHASFHMAQQQAVYIPNAIVNSINQLIETTLSILMLGALFLTLGWAYTLALVLLAIPVIAMRWYFGKATHALQKQNVELERKSAYLHHVLTSMFYAREVRTYDFGKNFLKRFRSLRDELFIRQQKLKSREAKAGFIAQTIEIVVIATLYLQLALGAIGGAITIGSFVLYFQAFQRLQGALKTWLQTIVQLLQSRIFLRDIFEFLDLPDPQADDAENQKSRRFKVSPPPCGEGQGGGFEDQNPSSLHSFNPSSLPSGLSVSHLSFSYPGQDRLVLRDVSFSCSPGEIIAFVGENGSGKSTLVKLISRLYEPTQGEISLNGLPIGMIGQDAFREMVSVIFQDFGRYNLTVEDNIRLGRHADGDEGRVEQSARCAGVHELIMGMPGGYNTYMDRSFLNSTEISGGQWQKLALARAFFRDAPLLILDEPTSHIDPLAEYELMGKLKKNIGNKMIILVSHRLHNLKIADRIHVMHDGVIAEHGTLSELLCHDGQFAEMYRRQNLREKN